jgi:hypothetical protein
MAERIISEWVDEEIADLFEREAALEGLSPSDFLSTALTFYLALPEPARASWARIVNLGTEYERNGALREVTRALVRASMAGAIARAQGDLPGDHGTDEDATRASIEAVERARRENGF